MNHAFGVRSRSFSSSPGFWSFTLKYKSLHFYILYLTKFVIIFKWIFTWSINCNTRFFVLIWFCYLWMSNCSSSKNTVVGFHALLQRTFLIKGSNLGLLCLLHGQEVLYHSAPGKPQYFLKRLSKIFKVVTSLIVFSSYWHYFKSQSKTGITTFI